ncbi:hypothetical protein UFOVP974_14 [uncultured Caudovirales phage]|uniref:Uncharacterized protein n=1 Tax=uncultured Caudovirales phage TaxID=2100421 RepID=A0A6J5T5N7_9CAUD|nr:hypothetical protein UFOVP974_14 [uncultured Caudovirales phage]CAB4194022.1 hypothetical protein UFOVP1256_2 [uncultured Caudovirales phage]CAB4222164.1 hypothetical protein UFOVP1643_24 [uncultured Caudovirales phage]
MANTYTLINSNTVGVGGAASVTFSSIPQTYTDLMVKVSVRSTAATAGTKLIIAINGVNTGYQGKNIIGDGSNVTSTANATTGFQAGTVISSYTASTFSNAEIYIPNYTTTSVDKVAQVMSVTENNATAAETQLNSGSARAATAVTSIRFAQNADNLAENSTFYLYGIKNS